ncbi:MAG: hypothetical protein JWQ01_3056, partial [Massilia sp.]|nr:hypothetical protein [Massilia sp.]
MFSNIRIGSRLALGFALVLLLSILSTTYALVAARNATDASSRMTDVPLIKERLVSDWYLYTNSGITRTSLIARSSDETLSTTFAKAIADSVTNASAAINKIEPLLETEEEKKLFKSIVDRRATYQAAKDEVMNVKKAGDAEGSVRIFNDKFMPSADLYAGQLKALLALQRKTIDDTSNALEVASARSFKLLVALGVLVVLLGATAAYLITRSITRPLR